MGEMNRIMGRLDCVTGELLYRVFNYGMDAFESGRDIYALEDERFMEEVNRLEIGVGRLKPREMMRLGRSFEAGWRQAAWDAKKMSVVN